MNVFSFTGNLGQDCKVNQVNGTSVCNFSVAVKAGYGDREQTLWIGVALWGQRAEGRLPEFLTKGQQVAVSGELSTREHEGKTYLECRANDVTLIGKRDQGGSAPDQKEQPPEPPQTTQAQPAASDNFGDDDDIPF